MPRNRCSDQRLLELGRGEPNWLERLRTRIHLTRCAGCRRRQAELELLEHALRQGTPDVRLSRPQVDAARQRFLARVAVEAPARVTRGRAGVRAAAALAASLSCFLVAGIGIWKHERSEVAAVSAPTLRAPRTVPPAQVEELAEPAVSAPRALAEEIATDAPRAPSATLEDAEVTLLWIVHQQGLCTQGSLEVTAATPGGLTVRGVVNSSAERERLEALLRAGADDIPATFDVRTAGDVVPNAAPVPVPPIALAAGKAAAGEVWIHAYLKGRGLHGEERAREAVRIANEAVRLAGTMSMEHWALRRLEERIEEFSGARLRAESRERLAEMRAAHVEALERTLAAEQALLEPVLGPPAAGAPPAKQVGQLAELIQDTFAGSTEAVESPREQISAWLAGSLAAVRQLR